MFPEPPIPVEKRRPGVWKPPPRSVAVVDSDCASATPEAEERRGSLVVEFTILPGIGLVSILVL
ncbi:uncharacterized protein Z520_10343 [Fonsecaea multimorphosa CBS 102226]|uniref:Uncharacterized protein n=1 Tax=Fonsecaea multimorphosa CBS 102226 TaxID=1442371 RepID=A0A0D2IA29_9EURO|nr:uncharacterized protein Z520_10343 [Fonsecaea multimorphosa CBS 102226]KIX94006.1 hypothetical protein Z520_10343 [Fonsecaea multimorphosa CBS 102226]